MFDDHYRRLANVGQVLVTSIKYWSSIGQAICRRFSQQGATVYILEISGQAARETVELIQNDGGKW